MTVLYKQPTETKIYAIEFSDQLATGDALDSITSGPTDQASVLTITGAAISGTTVQATYAGGVDGTTYHIVTIVATTNGETIETDVYLVVADSPSTIAGTVSFFTARARIADFLGWTRSSGNWDGTDIDRLDEIINAGYQQFIYPPPLEGETVSHEWSFLKPTGTFDTVGSTYLYDMPSTFGAMVGDLAYDEDEDECRIIKQTTPGSIDRNRAVSDYEGRPYLFALLPKSVAMSSAQVTELMLYPTPDAAYGILYHYDAIPGTLSETNSYMLGGQPHFETILQSCRDVAATRYKDDPMGREHALYLERLRASVEADRRLSPKTLGYNNDGRRIYHRRHGTEFSVSMSHNLGGGP